MKIGDIGYTIALSPCDSKSTLEKIIIKSISGDYFTGELLEGNYKGWSVYNPKIKFWKTKIEFNKAINKRGEKKNESKN